MLNLLKKERGKSPFTTIFQGSMSVSLRDCKPFRYGTNPPPLFWSPWICFKWFLTFYHHGKSPNKANLSYSRIWMSAMIEVESTRCPDSGSEDGSSGGSMTTGTTGKLSRSKREHTRGPRRRWKRIVRAMQHNGDPKAEWCSGLSQNKVFEIRQTPTSNLLEEFMRDCRVHDVVPVEEMLMRSLKRLTWPWTSLSLQTSLQQRRSLPWLVVLRFKKLNIRISHSCICCRLWWWRRYGHLWIHSIASRTQSKIRVISWNSG